MNEENNHINNKFLLVGDKFMPELHLWDLRVKKYSTCGPFTKHQKRINQFMKDGRASHIYKNELDKACFQHDAAYNRYKDLKGRFKIAVNPRVDGYQRALASLIWKFFNERSKKVLSVSNLKNKDNFFKNSQLADELHKPIFENFKRKKCILH